MLGSHYQDTCTRIKFDFYANLFLLNFIFQFLNSGTFSRKRVDLLLIFERNIRVFSADLQRDRKEKFNSVFKPR